jgi:accessory colonization factor AcfC
MIDLNTAGVFEHSTKHADLLWLTSADIGAHCLEGLGPLFNLGSLEHVYLRHQLNIHETHVPKKLHVLSIQESAAYSIGP